MIQCKMERAKQSQETIAEDQAPKGDRGKALLLYSNWDDLALSVRPIRVRLRVFIVMPDNLLIDGLLQG